MFVLADTSHPGSLVNRSFVMNRADRRKAARAGGKPSKGTRKDKRIKKNKK